MKKGPVFFDSQCIHSMFFSLYAAPCFYFGTEIIIKCFYFGTEIIINSFFWLTV